MTRDFYQVLQVDPKADAEVLEAAFRRLARKFHPDLNPAPDAGQRMRELNEAYGILRDPGRRAMYDAQRLEASRPPPIVAPAPSSRRPTATGPSRRSTTAPAPPPTRRAPRGAPPPTRPSRQSAPVAAEAPSFWRHLPAVLNAHRLIVLGAVSALLLTALVGAYAARLFEPPDRPTVAVGGSPGVVVVTRIPTAEPSATARPPAATTPAAWPPFVYIPVPILSAPEEPTPAASPTAGLESRP